MADRFMEWPGMGLGHSEPALAALFHCQLGLKLGNNGTESGKKGVPPAEPCERPEPQVGHPCPNYW